MFLENCYCYFNLLFVVFMCFLEQKKIDNQKYFMCFPCYFCFAKQKTVLMFLENFSCSLNLVFFVFFFFLLIFQNKKQFQKP